MIQVATPELIDNSSRSQNSCSYSQSNIKRPRRLCQKVKARHAFGNSISANRIGGWALDLCRFPKFVKYCRTLIGTPSYGWKYVSFVIVVCLPTRTGFAGSRPGTSVSRCRHPLGTWSHLPTLPSGSRFSDLDQLGRCLVVGGTNRHSTQENPGGQGYRDVFPQSLLVRQGRRT